MACRFAVSGNYRSRDPAALAVRAAADRLPDDPEPLDEREERGAERSALDLCAQRVPVDLLAERPRDLEHRPEVGLLLGQREKLRGEDVLDRRDRQRLRGDLERRRALEVLVAHGAAGGMEDQVDEDVAVPRLHEPALRRALEAQACRRERLLRAARRRAPARGSRRRGPSEGRRAPTTRARPRGGTAPSRPAARPRSRFIVSMSSRNTSFGWEPTAPGVPIGRVT